MRKYNSLINESIKEKIRNEKNKNLFLIGIEKINKIIIPSFKELKNDLEKNIIHISYNQDDIFSESYSVNFVDNIKLKAERTKKIY